MSASLAALLALVRWRAAPSSGRAVVTGALLALALLLAPGHGFSASSVNYGQIPKDAATLLTDAGYTVT